MTSRSAVLWSTHVWNRHIAEEFDRLSAADCSGSVDIWLVLDAKIPGAGDLARKYPRCLIIDPDALFRQLSYPVLEGMGILHHSHFPVLAFFLSHPEYDFYWFIEFDVRFTGQWELFLRSFEPYDHDFVAGHIRRFHDEPLWPWWGSFRHPERTIGRENYLRSYNVIFRISRRALEFIDHAQRNGCVGHNEVSLPTLLFNGGYRIMDYGGDGKFTPPELVNRFYTSRGLRNGLLSPCGTLHWRPSSGRAGIRRNRIYHPVKPGRTTEPFEEKIQYLRLWITDWVRYILLKCRD